MTLSLAPLTPAHPDLPRVMALMARAFPENERLPAAFLFDPGDGSRDFLAIHEGDTLCGFISLLSWRDITHLMFFAVEEAMRGRGVGAGRGGQRHDGFRHGARVSVLNRIECFD